MDHMRIIYTAGYEGTNIDDFVETLQYAGIETVVDIRELPLSRKPGFSKRALGDYLAKVGLNYVHLQALGDPKPGRDAARRGEYVLFRQIYSKQLKTERARIALKSVAEVARSKTVCLLCFERCHEHCHREMVAKILASTYKFGIKHIAVREGIASGGQVHANRARERVIG